MGPNARPPLHFCISGHTVTFFSLLLSLPLSFSLCYSRSELHRASIASTPCSPSTDVSCFGALIYGQYSLHHISAAAVCQGRDRKRRKEEKGNKETGRRKGERTERRHICSTHPSAKRYNYLSQHIIHVLYQPKAPCFTPPHSPRVGPIF